MTAKSIIEQVAEERAAEKQEKAVRDALLKKIEDWKARGYVIIRLEGLEKGDLAKMQEAYTQFEKDILELNTQKAALEDLDRTGLESDFAEIEANLKDPDKLADIKRGISSLREKCEERDDKLRKEAREHELRMKEEERLTAELNAKIEEEKRLKTEYEAKLKEEERELKALETQRLKEEKLCKELGLKEIKEEQKLAKLDERRDKAETERLATLAKYEEEKARLKELDTLSKKQELTAKAVEAKRAMEERMKTEAQAQKIRESRQKLEVQLKIKEKEKEDLSRNIKGITGVTTITDKIDGIQESANGGPTPPASDGLRSKGIRDAKTFEDDIINVFIRRMERFPKTVQLFDRKRPGKSKKIIVTEWLRKPSRKPYRVVKDDFIRVKMVRPDISQDRIPVNKMVYYVIPKKIVLGVWVCSRTDTYASKEIQNNQQPYSKEELSKCLRHLSSIKDAPIKIFALYSSTGWDDSCHSTDPIPSPDPNLSYAILEMRENEIISKTEHYDDYCDHFPRIVELPRRGVVLKAKKARGEQKAEEKKIAAPRTKELSADALELLAKKIASQLQTDKGVAQTDSGQIPKPTPSQMQERTNKESRTNTIDDWKAHLNKVDFTKKKELRTLAEDIQSIKKLDNEHFWPTFRIIWETAEGLITKGTITTEIVDAMSKVWGKEGSEKRYFALYGDRINIYVDRGRNPVGLLYYLICRRIGRKLTTDNYTAKWIKDRSKDFELDE